MDSIWIRRPPRVLSRIAASSRWKSNSPCPAGADANIIYDYRLASSGPEQPRGGAADQQQGDGDGEQGTPVHPRPQTLVGAHQ